VLGYIAPGALRGGATLGFTVQCLVRGFREGLGVFLGFVVCVVEGPGHRGGATLGFTVQCLVGGPEEGLGVVLGFIVCVVLGFIVCVVQGLGF
jgi:hypothetical protein